MIHHLGRNHERDFTQLRKPAALGGGGLLVGLTTDSLQQLLRRDIDDLDLVGGEQEALRNGLGHALAGDALDAGAQLLDVLKID